MLNRILLFTTVGIISTCALAQDGVIHLKNFEDDQIKVAGFKLKSSKSIKIEAAGAGADKPMRKAENFQNDLSGMYAYGWIIETDSREMVWRMDIDNTEKGDYYSLSRNFDDDVKLDEGTYEVYFSALKPGYVHLNGGFFSIGKLFKYIFKDEEEWEKQVQEWNIKISGVDETLSRSDVRQLQRYRKKSAIVSLTNQDDGEKDEAGFSLKQPLEIEIYALGEGFEGKMYDFAWILNAETREKIWVMRDRDTEHGGGAVKNRIAREKLKLDKGDYLVYYRTDDNHSAQEWNANPPYDPNFWGITIFASSGYDPSIVSEFEEPEISPIIAIERVGDYAYKEEALELTERTKLRIYSLGEGRSGDMFDYAWISESSSGDIVWKMEYEDTKHAGGASKNRLFDDIIVLPKGKYIVHYQTDDSHSYEDWNMRKPQEPKKWGVSVYPIGESETARRIPRENAKPKDIIVQLTRIGDDEHVRKRFTLEKETSLRVYCLGEGDEDEMYDYGWIENVDTGHRVWRMRYYKTRNAGGAEKNRLVDTIITLEPGTYEAHYRTDDSHSYYDWNERAPRDKHNWGITIYNMEN